jgi:Ca2+-binding EF-hand superfamily protein
MQQEKKMKTSIRLALAFLALAGAGGTAAFAADEQPMRHGHRDGGGAAMRFDRLDSDRSGDITFEEFSAAMKSRLGEADKNQDGKMSVAEIAQEIEKMRAERIARRLVERFDSDGDGMLTAAEINSRQRKLFALLDRNDDGKVVKDEMPRRKSRHGGRRF